MQYGHYYIEMAPEKVPAPGIINRVCKIFIKMHSACWAFTLSPRQIAAFDQYEEELLDWNARFNLTAIRDSESIRAKHFLDSLTCILAWRENPPACLIDVGTGAGFPGIPLKILQPSLQLALVELVGKKAEFCRHLSASLDWKK